MWIRRRDHCTPRLTDATTDASKYTDATDVTKSTGHPDSTDTTDLTDSVATGAPDAHDARGLVSVMPDTGVLFQSAPIQGVLFQFWLDTVRPISQSVSGRVSHLCQSMIQGVLFQSEPDEGFQLGSDTVCSASVVT